MTNRVNQSTDAEKNVTQRNYDGRELQQGEVLVAMDLGDEFIEANVTNPSSIVTVKMGRSIRKAVLVAIPEKAAAVAKSQLNLLQNEDNGKYRTKDAVSIEERLETYELDIPDTRLSPEDSFAEAYEREHAFSSFLPYINKLLEASPKHAYALLLVMQEIKGTAFMERMKLGHECANTIYKEAVDMYKAGLSNIDISKVKANKTKNTEYYLQAAKEMLDCLMDLLNAM